MKSATKCHNADRYKGLKFPTCGRDICMLKYRIKQLELKYNKLSTLLEEANDTADSASGTASAALYVANYCK